MKNPIQKYSYFLLISAIIGVDFYSINLGLFKLSIYRILILLSPIFYLYVSQETKRNFRTGANNVYFNFLLIWIFYSIITLLWVKDLSNWLRIFSFLICGCISTWFIGLYICKKQDFINALKIIEICALLFGSLGLYEIITGNYLFLSRENFNNYIGLLAVNSTLGIRIPISIFGNPNNFGFFFLFAIFGSVALSRVKNTFIGKIYSLILVIYFSFLLFASQSRAAFISLLLGLVIYTLIYLKQCSPQRRLLLILFLSILTILISSLIIANKRFYQELITFDISNGSDQVRLNLIKNGFRFLINSMFMGVGLGNIEYYMANSPTIYTGDATNMHNWWMEILVSSGVIIFLVYVIIYFKCLRKLFLISINIKDKSLGNISNCFFCLLVAFIIGSTGASTSMTSEWLWPIMGVIMSFVNVGIKTVTV